MFVEPGMIVTAPYHDIFTDEKKTGVFLVLNVDESNVMCCKITTKEHEEYDYYVDIPVGSCELVMDSKVCVSKIYTMHIGNLKAVIDRLPNEYLIKVIEVWNTIQNTVLCDLLKVIGGV